MERRYSNGEFASLLDIISIDMIEPRPLTFQTENHLIDHKTPWRRVGRATWEQIQAATDDVDALWENGRSSYHGHNDKVPQEIANGLESSLLLVAPTNLTLIVESESTFTGGQHRRVRATFKFNGTRHNFVVTDPAIEAAYLNRADGRYEVEGDVRICVSLAEVIGDSATKLVAAVITEDMV